MQCGAALSGRSHETLGRSVLHDSTAIACAFSGPVPLEVRRLAMLAMHGYAPRSSLRTDRRRPSHVEQRQRLACLWPGVARYLATASFSGVRPGAKTSSPTARPPANRPPPSTPACAARTTRSPGRRSPRRRALLSAISSRHRCSWPLILERHMSEASERPPAAAVRCWGLLRLLPHVQTCAYRHVHCHVHGNVHAYRHVSRPARWSFFRQTCVRTSARIV